MSEQSRGSYDDIIGLPRHVSAKRPRMPLIGRAAQFLPFAALSGYDAAVQEAARLTDRRVELSEAEAAALDARFRLLTARLNERPEITVTYFVPDPRKGGGSYQTVAGVVRKVDECARLLWLRDGARISMNDIRAVDGELFDALCDDEPR